MTRSNELGESLEETIERGRTQRGLLVYSMVPDEELEVTIHGLSTENVQIEEDRVVRAALIDQRVGKLHVIHDTAANENWTGKDVCLGSSVLYLGDIKLARGGLLRGMIGLGQGVVVDLSAQHFTGEAPDYLMAEYLALSLQDQQIF